MTDARYDVLGIGNAIVDVLARSDDSLLEELGLEKGAMRLVDAVQAEALYARMGQAIEMSGGSAGNTMAGIAALGGRGAYVGKVAADELGHIFTHDIRSVGIDFDTAPTKDGTPTARCLILVTEDAQRTMNTYLGACTELGPWDIDAETVRAAKVTYLEGYLWDPPAAKEAFVKAARIAHEAGRKVSLSLSDAFCVDRHRESFLDLVEHHVDILFANEAEIVSLYQTESFGEAEEKVKGHCEIAVLTRSEHGAVVLCDGSRYAVPAVPVETIVDTTGAGDLFAAGFLYGYTHGKDPVTSARIGAVLASEIISHYGARPEGDLEALVAEHLGAAALGGAR